DLPVGQCLPARDGTQLLPDPELEVGTSRCKQRRLARVGGCEETARASVLPKNIISTPKNDSNLGWRVTLASTQPIPPMIFGSILKYIRMSNNGTTNKIGK
ncbi:hypothetical protein Q604_UNBC14800G0001, partial [human gut metagenome]